MRVLLVGQMSVVVGERAVELPAGRPTELLAWLAAHPGLHPRSRVAPLFWPDVPDATSRSSLRTALWSLRRALGDSGDELIVVDRDRIGLGGSVWVDLRDALARLAEGDPEVAARAAAELAAVIDELVPGVEAEWADQLRERVRVAVCTRVEELADRAASAGETHGAAKLTRLLATLDPLSEDVHRLLLARLAAAGDTAAAVAEHAAFRRRLWDELRIVPSAATKQVVHALTADPPPPPPPAAPAPPAAPPAPASPALPRRLARADRGGFVARGTELEHLDAAWKRASEGGGPQLVLVGGPAGIGKTRLAARFGSVVNGRGAKTLFGSAAEDALIPGEPFLEAFGDVRAREPAELVTELTGRIRSMVQDGPALLVIDDLHWAESVTFAVLRRLMRVDVPLVALATYRTTDGGSTKLASLAADLARDCDVVQIDLPPFAGHDTAALVASLDDTGVLRDHAARIHDQTGGNPYFASELARYLLALSGSETSSPDAVPRSIRNLVAARLDHLSPPARDVVVGAAVLMHNAEVEMLRAMGAAGEGFGSVEEAIASGLIEHAGGRLEFPHAIVREAVYNDVSTPRRNDLHARAAAALLAHRGDAPGPHLCDVALHECASGSDPGRAIDTASAAAGWAVENHRYDLAVVVLTRALPLADDESRRRLAVRRAVAYQRLTHALYDVAPT